MRTLSSKSIGKTGVKSTRFKICTANYWTCVGKFKPSRFNCTSRVLELYTIRVWTPRKARSA